MVAVEMFVEGEANDAWMDNRVTNMIRMRLPGFIVLVNEVVTNRWVCGVMAVETVQDAVKRCKRSAIAFQEDKAWRGLPCPSKNWPGGRTNVCRLSLCLAFLVHCASSGCSLRKY